MITAQAQSVGHAAVVLHPDHSNVYTPTVAPCDKLYQAYTYQTAQPNMYQLYTPHPNVSNLYPVPYPMHRVTSSNTGDAVWSPSRMLQ